MKRARSETILQHIESKWKTIMQRLRDELERNKNFAVFHCICRLIGVSIALVISIYFPDEIFVFWSYDPRGVFRTYNGMYRCSINDMVINFSIPYTPVYAEVDYSTGNIMS